MIEQKSPSKISNQDQAQAAGEIVAELDIEIGATLVKINTARVEAQKLEKDKESLQARRKAQVKRLEDWCREDQKLDKKETVLELRHVTLQFRWTNPSVMILKRWTENKVLEAMAKAKKLANFIRKSPEINKSAILADGKLQSPQLTVEDLRSVGLRIGRYQYFQCQSKQEKTA